MSGRGWLLATALAALTGAGASRADTPTTGWDAVRDPAAAASYALHLRVREILAAPQVGPRLPTLVRARTLLEQAHAASSPDVRLRFDLGEVYERLDDNVHAAEVLAPALDTVPDDPATGEAFLALANAYAKLDQSQEERRVYERFLPKVTDDRTRSTAMLNLAEANMHLGNLEQSIAGYRATKDLAAQLPNLIELTYHTGALAVWGLAVALDRSGDIAGGAKEAKLAVELDHEMGIIRLSPDVFFAPERERDWYVALGFIEYAKETEESRGAALWWQRAEGCWREYIRDAATHGGVDAPTGEALLRMLALEPGVQRVVRAALVAAGPADRWIDVARARLEQARAQRIAAERRVKGRMLYAEYECVR
jgi:tetratricopeptide (TPR) repeat protein